MITVEREREEILVDSVRPFLQMFLKENFRALGALRSHRQIFDSRHFRIDFDILGTLAKEIADNSGGVLSWADGELCSISVEKEWFSHDILDNPEASGANILRGLWFCFQDMNYEFECVEIDPGISLDFFERMEESERTKFMERFAKRRRNSVIVLHPRKVVGFVAFVHRRTDDYEIKAIVPFGD